MAKQILHYLVVNDSIERIAPSEPEDGQTILVFRVDEDGDHTAEIKTYRHDIVWGSGNRRLNSFKTTVEAFCHYGDWELNFGGGGRDLPTSKELLRLQERMIFFVERIAEDAAMNLWDCPAGCVQDVYARRYFPGWNVGATRSFSILQVETGCYAMKPLNATFFQVFGPVPAPLTDEETDELGAMIDATRRGEAVDLCKTRVLKAWAPLAPMALPRHPGESAE
jgi:hypothetical protein